MGILIVLVLGGLVALAIYRDFQWRNRPQRLCTNCYITAQPLRHKNRRWYCGHCGADNPAQLSSPIAQAFFAKQGSTPVPMALPAQPIARERSVASKFVIAAGGGVLLLLVLLVAIGAMLDTSSKTPNRAAVVDTSAPTVASDEEPANPKRERECRKGLQSVARSFKNWERHGNTVDIWVWHSYYGSSIDQKRAFDALLRCAASEGRDKNQGINLVMYRDAHTDKPVAEWSKWTGFKMD